MAQNLILPQLTCLVVSGPYLLIFSTALFLFGFVKAFTKPSLLSDACHALYTSLTSQALHVTLAHSGPYLGSFAAALGFCGLRNTASVWLQEPKCRVSALPPLGDGGLQGERT